MSGFSASNSRIRVVETVGNVDETVFDTDSDMPHIIGSVYLGNKVVDFDNLTQSRTYVSEACAETYTNEFVLQYVPAQFNYEPVFEPAQWYWTSTYIPADYWTNPPYYGGYGWARVNVPSSFYYEPVYTPGFYQYGWEWVYNICGTYVPVYTYNVDAEEYASTTNLATLPTDEDGNAVDIDFIIVQATGSRSAAGKDPRFNQALPTTIPTKTFSFQGSVLLESSGKANGDSWLRRIMSVYTSGNQLKLKVQESVAFLARGANDSGFPHIGESRSTYSFNFKVFFGRFKS